MNATNPFPWREAIAFGLGTLKLSSADFWALTPRELACALEAVNGQMPGSHRLTRGDFDSLRRQFPDVIQEDQTA